MKLNAIAAALTKLPRVTSAVVATEFGSSIDIKAYLGIGNGFCSLRFQVLVGFPVVRPCISLLDAEPSRLAHVNPSGVVCIDESNSVASDLDAAGDVACWWLERALDVLDNSFSQAARGDFEPLMEELAGYWGAFDDARTVELLNTPMGEARRIRGFAQEGKLDAVSFQGARSERRHTSRHRIAQHERVEVAFLPLSVPVLPPARGTRPGARYIASAIESQPKALRARLINTVRCLPRAGRFRHYLLQQSLLGGAKNLVGLSVKVKRGSVDPVLDTCVRGSPVPWQVVHHYRTYQVPRGGALTELNSKTVAIVGCGSLGGELARLLVQSGVGRLILVDSDSYSIDNVHRHILPPKFIGLSKTIALQKMFQERFPDVIIHVYSNSLQDVETQLFSHSIDLVCLATGDPNIERDLVRRLVSDATTPPLLSGWIEPLSLGGHLVVSHHGNPGCLECNFHDHAGRPDLAGQVSFLGRGELVQRSLMGCAGTFTPYTVADAVQTAALMTNAAHDLILGYPGSFYRYWRGSSHQATAAGVCTSYWYKRAATVTSDFAATSLINEKCPVCAAWQR